VYLSTRKLKGSMIWLKRMKLLCCNYFSYCISLFPVELVFSAALLITVATLM